MYGNQVTAVESDAREMKMPNKRKIGFFKRWILKTVREAANADRSSGMSTNDELASSKLTVGRQLSQSIDQPERAIQFTVYNASGGRVVETRKYDRHKDRHSNGLYVITSDQDFGHEIDKIITMESLR